MRRRSCELPAALRALFLVLRDPTLPRSQRDHALEQILKTQIQWYGVNATVAEYIQFVCRKYVNIYRLPADNELDLAQRVTFTMWEQCHKVIQLDSIHAWLWGVAQRLAAKDARARNRELKRRARQFVTREELQPSPEELAQLQPRLQEVARLSYFEDNNDKTIAQILKVTHSSVRVYHSRIRKEILKQRRAARSWSA